MPARRSRNSLGSYQESWLLDEPSSDHLSADKVFLPPPSGWLFRSYVKRGRRYFEGDRGHLHNKRVRVYAQSVEEAKQKAARVESRIKQHGQLVADLTTEDLWEMVYCLKVCTPLGIRPFEACHSDDGRMFFSHYRVLVHRTDAASFWRIVRPAAFLTA